MPRILVLASCDGEIGDRPVMLDEELEAGVLGDRRRAGLLMKRVAGSIEDAELVERRIAELYA